MQHLPRALAGLGSYRQFILCQIAHRGEKVIKLPIDWRTMKAGDPHDPGTWLSYEELQQKISPLGPSYAVGFVFTESDPFFFLDIDKCIDDDGNLNEIATTLLAAVPGAAVERSQSGTGLHILGRGTCPAHGCKNIKLGIELYTERRFVMLTGTDATGDVDTDCSDYLPMIVESYFSSASAGTDGEWNDHPHPDWCGPGDDLLLLAKALEARSAAAAFGGKASFRDLFEANVSVLANVYPDSGGRDYDASSADAALAQHLAFWTGNHHERMLRLMWMSSLVRDKWEQRGDYYLHLTIQNATARQTQFYNNNRSAPSTVQPAAPQAASAPNAPKVDGAPSRTPTLTAGHQFMSVEQQLEYFEGCTYVSEVHRILTPGGHFQRPEQFKANFGGYVFALDSAGTKTTKNAWEVFTESQAVRFPKVYSHLFRPALAPGAIVEEEGVTYVNTYVPIETKRVPGDARPFLDLLQKILPLASDRAILLGYIAGVLQYPGIKFQYCPVLQGGEGNGKSTIMRCVEYGVGRRYTHQPNSSELARSGGKFTAWLDRKLFIGVEEIHVENKAGGLLDSLKPMITNDRIESQAKGVDQRMSDNCANWMMLCNRKDDVPVTTDTRRYSIFYSAQQSKDDCLAAGMNSAYWNNLYRWLKEEDGYAIVNNYLREYQIPDAVNPALIDRAPSTSFTNEAVQRTQGELESLVQEAIDSALVGFRGGWVSSLKLRAFLDDHRLRCPPSRVRDMMVSLGYDWHPGLAELRGRSSAVVAAEGGRPSLYLKREHISANLSDPLEIAKAYEKAQGYVESIGGAPGQTQSQF